MGEVVEVTLKFVVPLDYLDVAGDDFRAASPGCSGITVAATAAVLVGMHRARDGYVAWSVSAAPPTDRGADGG